MEYGINKSRQLTYILGVKMRSNKGLNVVLVTIIIGLFISGCTQIEATENTIAHHYTEAEKAVLMESYDVAIEEYSLAIKLLVDNNDENSLNVSEGLIKFGIGYCYEKLDKKEEAIEAYMASADDPRSAVLSMTALGKLYFDSQQYDLSKDYLVKTIDYDETAYEAYVNLSAIYSLEEDYDMALSLLSKAIEVDDNRADAFINRGYLFAKLGQEELMKEDIAKLKDLKEPNLDVYLKIYSNTLQEDGN